MSDETAPEPELTPEQKVLEKRAWSNTVRVLLVTHKVDSAILLAIDLGMTCDQLVKVVQAQFDVYAAGVDDMMEKYIATATGKPTT